MYGNKLTFLAFLALVVATGFSCTKTIINSGTISKTNTVTNPTTASRTISACPIFSADYPLNTSIDDQEKYPVLKNSDEMIAGIKKFGTNIMLSTVAPMPTVVTDETPLSTLTCDPAISWCTKNSLIGTKTISWPYPEDIFIVPGHDHHAYAIQETFGQPVGVEPIPAPPAPSGQPNCYLYETWWTSKTDNGFLAGGVSVFDLRNDLNYTPTGIGGSSASNIPIFAGLVTYDEAVSGNIEHALSVAVTIPQYGYIAPANTGQIPLNCAGTPTNRTAKALSNFARIQDVPCDPHNSDLPAMGQRFRLKQDFDETPFLNAPMSLAIIRALKKYGTVVTDGSGASFMLHADNDPRWLEHQTRDDLLLLKTKLSIDYFEAVESGPVTWLPLNVPNSKLTF